MGKDTRCEVEGNEKEIYTKGITKHRHTTVTATREAKDCKGKK
jgi:hypothetical protein